MSKIKIDGKDYELSSLSDEAKAQLTSLKFVDSEISRVSLQIAALQTARNAYGAALKNLLESGDDTDSDEVNIEGLGDTINFD